MGVVRDIYHDIKNNELFEKEFSIKYIRTKNIVHIHYNNFKGFDCPELIATIIEYPDTEYLVILDNDWGSVRGEDRGQELHFMTEIAEVIRKHVDYYKVFPARMIAEYAWTNQIPSIEKEVDNWINQLSS